MPHHTEYSWVEPGIMSVIYEGTMSVPALRESTEERMRRVDAAGVDEYVVVMDIRKAVFTFMDLRVAKWTADVDPRMIHVCLIGKLMMAQVMVSGLAKLTRLPVEFFTRPEDALARAQAVLKQRKMTH